MKTKQQLFTRIARDALSIPTLKPRNADSLDFHTVAVWNVEDALNAAFQAGALATVNGDPHADIDIDQLLENRRQVGVIWSIEDVQNIRPDLNKGRAWKVLQRCRRVHDCELGFTWSLIENVAEDLFGRNPSDDE